MTVSRRTLLSTLGLMLPVAAAEAATKRKPAHKPHKLAKAAPHKPAKRRRLVRRHTPAKPVPKQG